MEDVFKNFKEKIKELSLNEEALKSISFSKNEDNSEIICYFSWKTENQTKFFKQRNIFREYVKKVAKNYNLLLNKKKSTPTKYIFQYISEDFFNI